MTHTFGIDLGTTQSCIAYINEYKQPEVLENSRRSPTTPSVVYYDTATNKITVGQAAKDHLGIDPQNTVANIKREMPNPHYGRKIGNHQISPVNVSALILKKLVDDANEKLKNEKNLPPTNKVVITIPAYFGTLERARTEQAAKEAGLELLELINEPNAAALSYSANINNNGTFLIYDLGGGTFDVSIVQKQGKSLTVRHYDGEKELGGIDWDRALANMVLRRLKINKYIEDFKDTPEGSQLLLDIERIKINLSEENIENVRFSFIFENKRTEGISILLSDFESATKKLLDRTEKKIDKVIQDAGIAIGDIDLVIMVGGSSMMRMVQEMLKRKFGGKEKLRLADPILSIAKGAAIHSQKIQEGIKTDNILSKSYGLKIYTPTFKKNMIGNFIKKGAKIPISKQEYKVYTNQVRRRIQIEFYENDSVKNEVELSSENPLIRKEVWEFERRIKKGTLIKCLVNVDKSGIVSLEAECEGKKKEFESITR